MTLSPWNLGGEGALKAAAWRALTLSRRHSSFDACNMDIFSEE